MIWLLDKLRIIRGVYLLDFEGEVYRTWINRNPFYENFCHVYPLFKIGGVILNPDGTTGGNSTYIRRWKYMTERRTA